MKRGRRAFTIRQVLEIRRLVSLGAKQQDVARQYGVHFSVISKIVAGKTYAGWL